MNIAKLLLDEMQRVSRQVVSEKYNDPRAKDINQSLDAVIKVGVAKSNIPKQFRMPEMIFDSSHPTTHQRNEADQFYLRVACVMEYNSLLIELDNTLKFIFDTWHETKKLPHKYKGFWKYYMSLSKSVASKEEKKDCARYALLRTLDENEQMLTLGVIYRVDVSNIKQYENRVNSMTREERAVEKLRVEQLTRDNSPSWEVDNGKVRSAYILAFHGDSE